MHQRKRPATEEGGGAVIVPLWEWATARDARGGSMGVCRTRRAAMEALSTALKAAGRPASGSVAQVKLISPVYAEPGYLRGFPERRAVYDGTVIWWS
jgi:hypothetical protein